MSLKSLAQAIQPSWPGAAAAGLVTCKIAILAGRAHCLSLLLFLLLPLPVGPFPYRIQIFALNPSEVFDTDNCPPNLESFFLVF